MDTVDPQTRFRITSLVKDIKPELMVRKDLSRFPFIR